MRNRVFRSETNILFSVTAIIVVCFMLITFTTACGSSSTQESSTTSSATNSSTQPTSSTTSLITSSTTVTIVTTSASTGIMKSVDFMVTSTLSTAALGLIIVIKDASGQVLNLDATVSAKISADQDEDALNPGKIIQQWENVPLDKKEFLTAMGTAVNLPYNNFAPAENGQSGYINVTATVNGFSLNSVVKYLPFYEPCDCEEH